MVEYGEQRKKPFAVPIVIDDPHKERPMMAILLRLMVTYVIDYPGTPIGTQRAPLLFYPGCISSKDIKGQNVRTGHLSWTI